MLACIIDDLETILYETEQLKSNLNNSCEQSWSILCPPGSQNNAFKIERELPVSDKDHSSEASHIPSSLEGALDSVTDLIAYGKLLRSSTRLENKKVTSNINLEINKRLSNQLQTNTSGIKSTKSDKTINSLPIRDRVNNNLTTKSKSLKKSLLTLPNQKLTDEEKSTKIGKETSLHSTIRDSGGQDRFAKVDGQVLDKTIDMDSLHNKTKYSHMCSSSLSDIVKTLKMPEDLHNLLKHYYHYETNKLKSTLNKNAKNSCNFAEKFRNLANLRLQNDLKISTKPRERYLKYLDIADRVCKTDETSSGVRSIIWYESEEQLRSYEAKYQSLMKLQLQRRLMEALQVN